MLLLRTHLSIETDRISIYRMSIGILAGTRVSGDQLRHGPHHHMFITQPDGDFYEPNFEIISTVSMHLCSLSFCCVAHPHGFKESAEVIAVGRIWSYFTRSID